MKYKDITTGIIYSTLYDAYMARRRRLNCDYKSCKNCEHDAKICDYGYISLYPESAMPKLNLTEIED